MISFYCTGAATKPRLTLRFFQSVWSLTDKIHTRQGLFSTGGGRGKKQFKDHIRSTLLQLLSKRLPIKIKVNIKRYI